MEEKQYCECMRKIIRNYLQLESASGVMLGVATILALIFANSPFYNIYQEVTNSFHFFVNEGLMALFFLLVGLELKRGLLEDKFSSASDFLLPLSAAVGGMLLPAAIYVMCNINSPANLHGWAIPVATDIAFAVGVLSLFSKRLPPSLKLFLLSIAIFDDLGAIIIIALFYTQQFQPIYLFLAGVVALFLLLLNALNIRYLSIYLLGGAGLWFLFYKTGIHPTIAGVVTAFLIPEIPYRGVTPIHYLETKLHPWVAFGIMPLFAFFNAGLPLDTINFAMLTNGVTLGIILGLFVGKQLGIMSVVWLSIKTTRWAKLPTDATWLQLYGVALLCGIGFTMSLFLGTLSFQGQAADINHMMLGVMTGSLLSGIAGAIILSLATKSK